MRSILPFPPRSLVIKCCSADSSYRHLAQNRYERVGTRCPCSQAHFGQCTFRWSRVILAWKRIPFPPPSVQVQYVGAAARLHHFRIYIYIPRNKIGKVAKINSQSPFVSQFVRVAIHSTLFHILKTDTLKNIRLINSVSSSNRWILQKSNKYNRYIY